MTLGTHRVILCGRLKCVCWDPEKDKVLLAERGIGFERAAEKIAQLNYIALVEHRNAIRYPHQSVFVLEIDGYAYYVPFVETEDSIFLKTLIPSRKAKKDIYGVTELWRKENL